MRHGPGVAPRDCVAASERDEQRDAVDEDVGAEQEDEHRERRLRPDECEDAEHERGDAPDREDPPVAGHQTKHWNLLLSID